MIQRRFTKVAASRRMAGVTLIAALAASAGTAHAASADGALADYTALEQALTDGQSTVSVRLDMSRCTSTENGKPGPAVRGGLRIDTYLIPDNRFIAFSDEHSTLDPKNHPVTEYVRYRVMPDNTATVDTEILANGADTAQPRGSYRCTFNQGIRFIATASH
jgi:VirK protein